MFFMIPPAEPVQLPAPRYVKALTIRVTNIQPSGYVNVYTQPFKGMPTRIEAASSIVGVQKMDGAQSYTLELVSAEPDKEAERRANEPQPIYIGRERGIPRI